MSGNYPDDEMIRESLIELDESDFDVNEWEATFIDVVCYKYEGPLSEKQLAKSMQILEKYDLEGYQQ